MRDLSNFSLSLGVDILRGRVGEREARGVLGSIRETRRNIQVGQQIGEHKQVLDAVTAGGPGAGEDESLREERELTARLEQLRERRAAGC